MSRTLSRVTTLTTLTAGLVCAGFTLGAAAQNATSMPSKAKPTTMAASGSMAPMAKNTVPGADQAFMKKAAIGGMTEVQLGTMAQQKGASDQVKQFGAKMAQDHGKANDELKQIASTKGVALPEALDAKAKQDVAKFGKMTGAGFDKAYMSHMVEDHKQDIAEFKKESTSGKDDDVKAFATKTLPTLQEHLQLAQAGNDAVKKSK
ncbi:MAG: DUF4142 domain-containing protein [Caldimonas sp.]